MSAMLDSLAGAERRAVCAQHARHVVAELWSRVAGIPCQIGVTHYLHVEGSGNRWTANSDADYRGYTEVDFDVLDYSGRPAPWLERKLASADRARIEREVVEFMERPEAH